MNIQQAKQEIIHTLRAYLAKDETGSYTFPTVRQRPILLMGPPGIGKTAIMEQISQACGVGLVAYTMTHHTRQSAIGLPHIVERNYNGESFRATEYTLSEIIASVYETMEKTGYREGILFLDEINCVSETLAPTMLQFLQNKTFGSHKVPDGWIIVAAGNPPEYNKSVRDFDIVTLDRVREISVEADLQVWLDYARQRNIHGAILSYLTIKNDRFYLVEHSEDQLCFVTARGWEDLSAILRAYEEMEVPITTELVGEFLRKDATARDFAAYYQLYQKYGTDYGIHDILYGTMSADDYKEKQSMAAGGGFEERFTVVNLVLDQLLQTLRQYLWEDKSATQLHAALKQLIDQHQPLDAYVDSRRNALHVKQKSGLLTATERKLEQQILNRLDAMEQSAKQVHLRTQEQLEAHLRTQFQPDLEARAQTVSAASQQLERAFRFIEDCFGDGQEMVLLVSTLTRSEPFMEFVRLHGCTPYLKFSKALLYRQQEAQLQQACRELTQG